jgi:O-antigen ligase
MTILQGTNSSEFITRKSKTNWLVVLMAVGLHQSLVYSGINFSLTDIFLLVFVVSAALNGEFKIPLLPLLFFIILSITSAVTATYITPILFHVNPEMSSVFVAWIKLLSLLLYFISGYLIVKQQSELDFLISFAYTGMFIGVISVFVSFLTIAPLQEYLFFGGIRFKGFLSDPNLYAVMTIASFAAYLTYKNPKWWIQAGLWILLFWCVVISGSKTGLIVSICLLIFTILKQNLLLRKPRMQTIILTFLLAIIALFFQYFQKLLMDFSTWMSVTIPGAERLLILFSDFNSALGEGGSSRLQSWHNAWSLIVESPIVGVGIGTYGDVAYATVGSRVIAHNTFLQLFAEWGMLLTIMFFGYVLYIVFDRILNFPNIRISNAFSEIIIVFLFASMAVSLNNARLFWIALGVVYYYKKSGQL